MQEYNCRSARKDKSAMAGPLLDRATQLSDSVGVSSNINNLRNNDEPAQAESWPDKGDEHKPVNQDELIKQNMSKDLVCKDDSASAEPLYKPSLCFAEIDMAEIRPCQVSVARIKVNQEPLSAVQGEAKMEEKAKVRSNSTRTWVTEAFWILLDDSIDYKTSTCRICGYHNAETRTTKLHTKQHLWKQWCPCKKSSVSHNSIYTHQKKAKEAPLMVGLFTKWMSKVSQLLSILYGVVRDTPLWYLPF